MRIEAGSNVCTSQELIGYRKAFFGCLPVKEDITAETIRNLSQSSNKPLNAGDKFTINIVPSAKRVVFAYPSICGEVDSVIDTNGLALNIKDAFIKHANINVPGANDAPAVAYNVYYIDYSEEYGQTNTYVVTV